MPVWEINRVFEKLDGAAQYEKIIGAFHLCPKPIKSFNNPAFKSNVFQVSCHFTLHPRVILFAASDCIDSEQPTGSNESGERFVLDIAATLQASDVQSIADQCDKAAPPVFGPQVMLRVQIRWSNKNTNRSELEHLTFCFFTTHTRHLFGSNQTASQPK